MDTLDTVGWNPASSSEERALTVPRSAVIQEFHLQTLPISRQPAIRGPLENAAAQNKLHNCHDRTRDTTGGLASATAENHWTFTGADWEEIRELVGSPSKIDVQIRRESIDHAHAWLQLKLTSYY